MTEEQDWKQVGRHRAGLRDAAGLTQVQLAVAADVSLGVVQRAESGATVNEDSLRKLAAAVGVSLGAYADSASVASEAPAESTR